LLCRRQLLLQRLELRLLVEDLPARRRELCLERCDPRTLGRDLLVESGELLLQRAIYRLVCSAPR
jgi:hypothetical protein